MSEANALGAVEEAPPCNNCIFYRQENLLKDALIERLQCLIDELRTTETNLLSETSSIPQGNSPTSPCNSSPQHRLRSTSSHIRCSSPLECQSNVQHSKTVSSPPASLKQKEDQPLEECVRQTCSPENALTKEYERVSQEMVLLKKQLQEVQDQCSTMTNELLQRDLQVQELTSSLDDLTSKNTHLQEIVDSVTWVLQDGARCPSPGRDVVALASLCVSQLKKPVRDSEVMTCNEATPSESQDTQTENWLDDSLASFTEVQRDLLHYKDLVYQLQNEENRCRQEVELLMADVSSLGEFSLPSCQSTVLSELLQKMRSAFMKMMCFCTTVRQHEGRLLSLLNALASQHSLPVIQEATLDGFRSETVAVFFDSIMKSLQDLQRVVAEKQGEIDRLHLEIKEKEEIMVKEVDRTQPQLHDWCGGTDNLEFTEKDGGVKRLRKEVKRLVILYKKEQEQVSAQNHKLDLLQNQIRELFNFVCEWRGLKSETTTTPSVDTILQYLEEVKDTALRQLLEAAQEKEATLVALHQSQAMQKQMYLKSFQTLHSFSDSSILCIQHSEEDLTHLDAEQLVEQMEFFLKQLLEETKRANLELLSRCESLQLEGTRLQDRVIELENASRVDSLQSQYVQTEALPDSDTSPAIRSLQIKYEKALKRLKSSEATNVSLRHHVSFLETEIHQLAPTLAHILPDSACVDDASQLDGESLFHKMRAMISQASNRMQALVLEKESAEKCRDSVEADLQELVETVVLINERIQDDPFDRTQESSSNLRRVKEILKEFSLPYSTMKSALIREIQQQIHHLTEAYCRLLHDVITCREAFLAFSEEDVQHESLTQLVTMTLRKLTYKPKEKIERQLQDLEGKVVSIRESMDKLDSLPSEEGLLCTVSETDLHPGKDSPTAVRRRPRSVLHLALLKQVQELLILAHQGKEDVKRSYNIVENAFHKCDNHSSVPPSPRSPTPLQNGANGGIHCSNPRTAIGCETFANSPSISHDNQSDSLSLSTSQRDQHSSSIHPV